MHWLMVDPFLNIVFWFRIISFLQSKGGVAKLLGKVLETVYSWLCCLTGVSLPIGTDISGGFSLHHALGTVINRDSHIGANVTLLQNVTIGIKHPGGAAPVIGDNVVICAGAIIIGNVHVGNDVVVGAGTVVLKDVPDSAVIVGPSAKIISFDGKKVSNEYRILG